VVFEEENEQKGKTKGLKRKDLNGGRAGTRTPDLLRVKQENCFHSFQGIHELFFFFNKLGHLLRSESISLLFAADGVLIRF
jgi:hypothetical protein